MWQPSSSRVSRQYDGEDGSSDDNEEQEPRARSRGKRAKDASNGSDKHTEGESEGRPRRRRTASRRAAENAEEEDSHESAPRKGAAAATDDGDDSSVSTEEPKVRCERELERERDFALHSLSLPLQPKKKASSKAKQPKQQKKKRFSLKALVAEWTGDTEEAAASLVSKEDEVAPITGEVESLGEGSELDLSDDEPDTDNLVVCQYESISRVKNKVRV